MMTCDDWKAFAHDYVFGDLSDSARERLDRHAESCSSCLREAGTLKAVDRRLRQVPEVEPPAHLSRRALEDAPARTRRELWRVAAVLLVAGVLGAFITLPDDVSFLSQAARLIPDLRGDAWLPN
jgi:anti-sigma factor RsiW